MVRLFIVTFSYLAIAIVTVLAYCIQINDHTALEISTTLPVLLAPANYAYIILIFVIIWLAIWVITLWKQRKNSNSISYLQTFLFALSSIFYVLATILWNKTEFTLSISMFGLLVLTLAGLYFTYPVEDNKISSRVPISFYFGWMTFLLITNVNFTLTLNEWNGLGLSNQLWAVIFMTIGTAIALHIRFHHFDITYPIVLIWAYLAVAFQNSFDELLVTTAALFLSGVMIVGILFIKKNPAYQK